MPGINKQKAIYDEHQEVGAMLKTKMPPPVIIPLASQDKWEKMVDQYTLILDLWNRWEEEKNEDQLYEFYIHQQIKIWHSLWCCVRFGWGLIRKKHTEKKKPLKFKMPKEYFEAIWNESFKAALEDKQSYRLALETAEQYFLHGDNENYFDGVSKRKSEVIKKAISNRPLMNNLIISLRSIHENYHYSLDYRKRSSDAIFMVDVSYQNLMYERKVLARVEARIFSKLAKRKSKILK